MTLATGKRGVSRGFTLIELILVMAMLLIVLAVSMPSLSRFFRGRVLDSEARRFLSLTRYAQSRAVSEGVPMLLWVDADQGFYGLREEPGYSDVDVKEVEVEVGERLEVELYARAPTDYPALGGAGGGVIGTGGMGLSSVPAGLGNVPMIRFLPDGFIAEGSLGGVVFREGEEDALVIGQSRDGMRYEITTETSFLSR